MTTFRKYKRKYFGTLYVIGMPIGNNQDISVRALDIVRNNFLIICEDVAKMRNTLIELGVFKTLNSISNLTSAINMAEKELMHYKNIVLIANQGTFLTSPNVSMFINHFLKHQQCNIKTIPGPSAVTCAFAVSGFKGGFLFHGHLPVKNQELYELFNKLLPIKDYNLVFLENESRIENTLKICSEIFKDREARIIKNIGQFDEEVICFNLNQPTQRKIEGSFVFIVKNAIN